MDGWARTSRAFPPNYLSIFRDQFDEFDSIYGDRTSGVKLHLLYYHPPQLRPATLGL